jgi:hypothetical protein
MAQEMPIPLLVAGLYQRDNGERYMRSMGIKSQSYSTLLQRSCMMVIMMQLARRKILRHPFTGLILRTLFMTMILSQKIGISQLKHFARFCHLYSQQLSTFQTVPSGYLEQFQNQIAESLSKR